MQFSWNYFAAIISSTLRNCSPLLYCSLAAAICKRADVFNISMEGTMLASAFFSIVVNYYTHNLFLSVLAGAVTGMVVSAIVGFFTIRLKASPVVVGMAVNTMMDGVTMFLLYVIFHTKGVFTDPSLVGLTKINVGVPVLSDLLSGMTILDYFAYVSALLAYIFLYKTVAGYHIRALGINGEAARSLGTPVDRYRFITITLSGILCGFAGVLLSMGSVTLFIQNISSGRGYIAMAANNLGRSHPLGVLGASIFFGCCQALGNFLQNTSLKGQITDSIPYVATIAALIIFTLQKNRKKAQKMKKVLSENGN